LRCRKQANNDWRQGCNLAFHNGDLAAVIDVANPGICEHGHGIQPVRHRHLHDNPQQNFTGHRLIALPKQCVGERPHAAIRCAIIRQSAHGIKINRIAKQHRVPGHGRNTAPWHEGTRVIAEDEVVEQVGCRLAVGRVGCVRPGMAGAGSAHT